MKKLDIIYEDKNLLVVNKPSKMLTISDGKVGETMYSLAREYVKKQHKSNKIFIVHRLDRDTSGILLFAKNEQLKHELQESWNQIAKREYLAIVEGHLKNQEGIIQEYLVEDKTHRVYATTKEKGEYAETHYEVIRELKNVSVLKIEIKTGKKNQIRVGLANLGNPILGDKKYGSANSTFGRLGLHASLLEVMIQNKKYTFSCKEPKEFLKYLK